MELETTGTVAEAVANLLTAREVVDKVFGGKISYRMLLDMCKKDLHCWKVGRRYFFDEKEIRNWVQKNTSTPSWAKVRA